MDLKLNIFIAYSREDDKFRIRLEKHLSTLKRRDFINTWYDGKIEAGTEWKQEIDKNLNGADIILLLISADFIASDYCYEVEMKRAIERHSLGEAIVIPILLHNCDWEDTPFGKIQALPQNGKPVTDKFWDNPENGLSRIAKSIKSLVQDRIESKRGELQTINSKIKQAENVLKEYEEKCEDLKDEKYILEKDKVKMQKEVEKLQKEMEMLIHMASDARKKAIQIELADYKKYKNRIKKLEKQLSNLKST